MEAAWEFMQRLLEYPVRECGEPLCPLPPRAADAGVEIAFAPGRKLGLFDRVFHVRDSLVEKLLAVAEAFARGGFVLRIEDAYRSPETQARGARSEYIVRAVLEKVLWELDGRPPTPELVFRRLAVWTATTPKFANHTSGSAVDISVQRRDGAPLDLGGVYPELSLRTPMASPFVSEEVRRNRRMVCDLFAAEGFVPYPFEFWHFSQSDADAEMISHTGRAGRFGPVHWSPAEGKLTPVADVLRPFITADDIRPHLAERGWC
jgi:D-alanyl-D-alanine dipeptidase